MIVMRHARADQAWLGLDNDDRPLSAIGIRQAESIRANFNIDDIYMVLTSPAQRTRMTALSCLAGRNGICFRHFLTLKELSTSPPGVDVTALSETFNQLSYSRLSDYLSAGTAVRESLQKIGRQAIRAVIASVGRNNPEQIPRDIFVCGHAVLLPAMVWALGEMCADTEWPLLRDCATLTSGFARDMNLGEARSVTVRVSADDRSVSVV